MLNIFASLKVYAGKWAPKANMVDDNNQPIENPRNLTEAEVASIFSAIVVPSEYGNSVEFTRVGGGKSYIPLDRDSTLGIGDIVDVTKAKILTLEKQGEDDILRVVI
jgi:hypothetical protein